MHFWQWLFLVSGFLVFYNYAGYVIPVWIINKLFAAPPGQESPAESGTLPAHGSRVPPAANSGAESPGEPWPTVSFIVAAYNEEACIIEKISNSLEQDYPA